MTSSFVLRRLATALAILVLSLSSLTAQETTPTARETPISTCMAVAELQNVPISPGGWPGLSLPGDIPILKASATSTVSDAIGPSQVKISYVGHSTFRIEDATGLAIATDYAGFAGIGVVPDVVTMNHAHATHFTVAPDPRIPHVLRGWGKDGTPARYHLQIGEAIVRNVTTDINNQWAGYEPDGNSIFIFEMGGLCIGHLGHLHHRLTDDHYAQIGRLDVLMIPVDGGYTLNVADMSKIASRLQSSVILPMHWFGEFSLQRFLDEIRDKFPIERTSDSGMILSLNTLPAQPRVIVLTPESSIGIYDGD